MTPLQIKHAALGIWNLREHSDQALERDAMNDELARARSRKVETLSAEEYERRKRIEEERDIKLMEEGKLSIQRGEVPTTSMAGTIPRGGAAHW